MATTQPPKTETKTVSETRQHFSETLNRVYRGETRVVVEKSGIAVGVIVSPRDLEALQHIEEERRLTLEAFADARKAFDGIPHEEIEREIEMAIADARAGRRNEDPWAVIGDMREAFAGADQEEFQQQLANAIRDVRAEYDKRHAVQTGVPVSDECLSSSISTHWSPDFAALVIRHLSSSSSFGETSASPSSRLPTSWQK